MYSPKIKEELIRKLYQIRKETGKPMTKLVDEMIRAGIRRHREKKKQNKKPVVVDAK